VDQVGHQALIETAHTLVPPSLFDAVPGAVVAVVVVLQPRPHHLVRVGGRRRDQLGYGREGQVLGGGLWERKHILARETCIERLPNRSDVITTGYFWIWLCTADKKTSE